MTKWKNKDLEKLERQMRKRKYLREADRTCRQLRCFIGGGMAQLISRTTAAGCTTRIWACPRRVWRNELQAGAGWAGGLRFRELAELSHDSFPIVLRRRISKLDSLNWHGHSKSRWNREDISGGPNLETTTNLHQTRGKAKRGEREKVSESGNSGMIMVVAAVVVCNGCTAFFLRDEWCLFRFVCLSLTVFGSSLMETM